MKSRGMHDIPTFQSLINRSIPATRAEIVARLARMEHKKARLVRELDVWVSKQKKTEERLQQVRQHVELLQRALDEGRRDSGTQRMAEDGSGDGGEEARPWREISLEY